LYGHYPCAFGYSAVLGRKTREKHLQKLRSGLGGTALQLLAPEKTRSFRLTCFLWSIVLRLTSLERHTVRALILRARVRALGITHRALYPYFRRASFLIILADLPWSLIH
jgi:hypothetical protein